VSILNPSGRAPIIGDVDSFDCKVTDEGWPWAEKHASAITAHWQTAISEKPHLFDGEVLVATEVAVEGSRLAAELTVVRYSALNFWTKSGFPHAGTFNLFGAGVVVTKDGAVLLGEMAAHTANAGFCYFPCGTPDTGDVTEGDRLDIEGSIRRELEEETGLGAAHLKAADTRWISWDGALFCCARRYDTGLTAEEAGRIASAHIEAQERPELERVHFVRHMDDLLTLNVPAYASALVEQVLQD
jgi:8-oxo-dGTP pyrophosphatase MutT (NUDIX family)